jgi:hypothetical protein
MKTIGIANARRVKAYARSDVPLAFTRGFSSLRRRRSERSEHGSRSSSFEAVSTLAEGP